MSRRQRRQPSFRYATRGELHSDRISIQLQLLQRHLGRSLEELREIKFLTEFANTFLYPRTLYYYTFYTAEKAKEI